MRFVLENKRHKLSWAAVNEFENDETRENENKKITKLRNVDLLQAHYKLCTARASPRGHGQATRGNPCLCSGRTTDDLSQLLSKWPPTIANWHGNVRRLRLHGVSAIHPEKPVLKSRPGNTWFYSSIKKFALKLVNFLRLSKFLL